MEAVESSAVEAIGYDPVERVLAIRFTGGATYLYPDVPQPIFDQLRNADSKGRFVNGSIKPHFRAIAL